MHAGGLRASQQGADVLRILERVEHEDERRLATLDGAGEDVVETGVRPRLDDEGDALMAVEPGHRGQRPALDLHDRDPQRGRMENESLERLAALGYDEEATGRSPGDEGLLDGAPSGDELLVVAEQIRGCDTGPIGIRRTVGRVAPRPARGMPYARGIARRPGRSAEPLITSVLWPSATRAEWRPAA